MHHMHSTTTAKGHTMRVGIDPGAFALSKMPTMRVTPTHDNKGVSHRVTSELIYRIAAALEASLPEQGYVVCVETHNRKVWIETTEGTDAQNRFAFDVLTEVARDLAPRKRSRTQQQARAAELSKP